MTKRELARKAIVETGLKSKKALATYLVEKHPEAFKDMEHARAIVRQATGASGEKSRKQISDPEKTKFFYNGFEKWAGENLNTDDRPWAEPYEMPAFKKLNVIADLHSIHLDPKAMIGFLKQVKNKEAILINGDLIDSESLSRHIKGHNVVEYERELEICHQILKGLKEEFTHVYFKMGNHDFWLERYLLTNARELFRLRGLQLPELLRCGELGVHTIHQLKYIKYGDLDIIHGHEFNSGFGNGKFPSVGYIDKWQTFKGDYDVKILASHCHRQDVSISRRSKDGKYGQGWVTPAMCKKGAQYSPYSGWDTGWAELTNNDGVVDVKICLYEEN